jgi:putative tricarboxylic transport membrane protein
MTQSRSVPPSSRVPHASSSPSFPSSPSSPLSSPTLSRRGFSAWITASAAAVGVGHAAFWPRAAHAADAPLSNRLRIVIPASEGGGWDQTGRALGAAMLASGAVGNVVYENIGGKGGTIGLAKYAEKYDADPDTILMSGMVMVGAVALQKPAVTMAHMAPVARLTSDYEVVAVKADSPIKTPKDLIAQLRADAGGTVIAGGSAGGVDHMYAGMLARVAEASQTLAYQAHPGGAEVVEALDSGKAAAGISGYSEFAESLASGKLRAIGVSSKRPFQGIASVREQGVDADLANWRGVLTGRKVPPYRRTALLTVVRRATATDVWQKTVKSNNWDAFWAEGKDFENFLELDTAMAGPLIYLLKLKA